MSSEAENLPPMMGFPQECIIETGWCVPFYTCVIGPFRVFVYFQGGLKDEGWTLERVVNEPHKKPENLFFGGANISHGRKEWPMHPDPLTVKILIHHVTSESNNDEPDPTGAAYGVCPLPQEK